MRRPSPYLRVFIALLSAVALTVAAPIHASHDHAGDVSQTDGPCVVCKVLTTGSAWTAPVSLSPQLQPVGTLAADTRVIAHSAPAPTLAPRAPPFSFV